jgi:hypothetical protein
MTSEEIARLHLTSRKTSYSREEFDEPTTLSDTDILQETQNLIQVGPVGLELDKLPGPLRQIVFSPDDWFVSKSNKLFRVVDPITQVVSFGEWGSDIDEADEDVLSQWASTGRLFLEHAGLVLPDEPTTASSLFHGPIDLAEHGDLETRAAGLIRCDMLPESAADHISMFDSDESDDETVSPNDPRFTPVALPCIPEETLKEIDEVTREYREHLAKLDNERDRELLSLVYEQRVDQTLSAHLTTSLNSPYCGRGYSPPRRKHLFIPTPRPSSVTAAAEERVATFYQLFAEAGACSSNYDLFGDPVVDTRRELDGQPNPNYGKTSRPGGFYGRIRGMHAADKALATKWSIHKDYKKPDGSIVRSAFTVEREQFIRTWRKEQKGDEESLRVALWAWFDRTAGERKAIYDQATGRLLEPRRVFRDSIWRQKRTQALTELCLTKPQWDGIYAILEIVRQKLRPDSKFMEKRAKILRTLREMFVRIQSLQDLTTYTRWAQKRTFIHTISATKYHTISGKRYPVYIGPRRNTYKPRASLLDQITAEDERLWKKSCIKKRKHLQRRLFISRWLAKRITRVTALSTSCPQEVTLPCPEPYCSCMAYGIPRTAHFGSNKKLDFIICEGCNCYVWLIEYKEPFPLEDKASSEMELEQGKAKENKQCNLA